MRFLQAFWASLHLCACIRFQFQFNSIAIPQRSAQRARRRAGFDAACPACNPTVRRAATRRRAGFDTRVTYPAQPPRCACGVCSRDLQCCASRASPNHTITHEVLARAPFPAHAPHHLALFAPTAARGGRLLLRLPRAGGGHAAGVCVQEGAQRGSAPDAPGSCCALLDAGSWMVLEEVPGSSWKLL